MSPRSSYVLLGLLPLVVFAAEPAAPDAAPAPAAAAEVPAAPPANADPAAATAGPEDASPPAAGDALVRTDREAEYARIAPRLAAGDELQWLEAAGSKFVALIRKPRQGPPRGALLIVPAPQELVDRHEVIQQLRTLPPVGGYVTLALQPPLGAVPPPAADTAGAAQEAADVDASKAAEAPAETATAATSVPPIHPDFCPRVAAALAALQAVLPPPPENEAAPPLAIAAAEASVPAVLGCYADGLPAAVRAFAAFGRWPGDFGALAVPSIEFVPLRDPAAVKAADARAAQPLADDAPPRRRVDVDGVDVHLDGAGEDLAKRLRGWLEHLPPPPVAKTAAEASPNVSS